MKILVTGGSGVIGAGVIRELRERGHGVRLLSRHADEDIKQFTGVEPFRGNVADPESVAGAALGCDAVLHIAGIVAENPPALTFDSVNVGGTRNMLDEARRSGVKRFLYLSSLGADHGGSAYHRSKLEAEQLVQQSGLRWLIVRPGNVYGPGDEVLSLILKMVRTLPAVPVIDDGSQQFQPIWYEDLGRALATALERDDVWNQLLEIAGNEITTMNDVIDRFREITGRHPLRIPVPELLASLSTTLASIAGVKMPVDENKLTMLREKNVLADGVTNGLRTLGVEPVTLDRGLRLLADALPEQLAEDGVGAMEHKHYWIDIRDTTVTARELMQRFCDRISEIMPIEFEAEPDVPHSAELGATMTAALPLRGNVQIRVEVVEPTRVVLGTIEGHPLAGIVQFTTGDVDAGVRFEINIYTRAANVIDFVAMKTVGRPAQDLNWRAVTQKMIDQAGGVSDDGVQYESTKLSDDEAKAVESEIREMIHARQRSGAEAEGRV